MICVKVVNADDDVVIFVLIKIFMLLMLSCIKLACRQMCSYGMETMGQRRNIALPTSTSLILQITQLKHEK